MKRAVGVLLAVASVLVLASGAWALEPQKTMGGTCQGELCDLLGSSSSSSVPVCGLDDSNCGVQVSSLGAEPGPSSLGLASLSTMDLDQ